MEVVEVARARFSTPGLGAPQSGDQRHRTEEGDAAKACGEGDGHGAERAAADCAARGAGPPNPRPPHEPRDCMNLLQTYGGGGRRGDQGEGARARGGGGDSEGGGGGARRKVDASTSHT